jgi:hypothetical protein
MVIDRQHNNRPELRRTDRFEVADQYVYLGSLITNNGTTDLEIQRRCEMSKIAMKKLTKIWRDNSISKQLKVRLVQCLVFPILMYGCEARTLKQNEKMKINTTEMGCWRKLLNIPWTAYRTNEVILKELKIKLRLSDEIQLRIIRYFGHIMRRELDNMDRLILQGKVEGTRLRGRSQMRWTDQITKSSGKTMHGLYYRSVRQGPVERNT